MRARMRIHIIYKVNFKVRFYYLASHLNYCFESYRACRQFALGARWIA